MTITPETTFPIHPITYLQKHMQTFENARVVGYVFRVI